MVIFRGGEVGSYTPPDFQKKIKKVSANNASAPKWSL